MRHGLTRHVLGALATSLVGSAAISPVHKPEVARRDNGDHTQAAYIDFTNPPWTCSFDVTWHPVPKQAVIKNFAPNCHAVAATAFCLPSQATCDVSIEIASNSNPRTNVYFVATVSPSGKLSAWLLSTASRIDGTYLDDDTEVFLELDGSGTARLPRCFYDTKRDPPGIDC
ncbi:uncharacterized protein L969DRAFT_289902 [Mixia osmundae IAM 14324]|uniref:Uncharacterized protein n=1 Tax=Mixia osmundae (strain CBS 9802 / IAM 14324 / JCM 22182 / KY 12970) TaxID=764103 RepID=G7DXN0_MIXOS|nr:uncharacterized protein L969DRAFT_289902 [Mixia osmundae IAM 14324]KEI41166.1 hypothetical protein L969DRAFT_289902 [Mixia osmundae IAM 14324]GAA95340.1 hypothetical protein E5Q_01997 [Mixia osmundae IAM 14324]